MANKKQGKFASTVDKIITETFKTDKQREDEAKAKADLDFQAAKQEEREQPPVLEKQPVGDSNAQDGKEAGQAFISEREKARGAGATRDEANRIANERTQGIGTDAFQPGLLNSLNQQNAALLDANGNLPPTIPNQNLPEFSNILAGAGGGALAELGTGGRVATGALAAGTAPFSLPIAAGVIAGGFLVGTFLSMRQQAKDTMKVQSKTLVQNRNNLDQYIGDVNLGIDPKESFDNFSEQLRQIDQAYSNLKYTETIKNRVVGADADVNLENFQRFYAPGGDRERAILQMSQALNAPNPQLGAQILQARAAMRPDAATDGEVL